MISALFRPIDVTSVIYVDVLREVQRDAVDHLGHLFGLDDKAGTASSVLAPRDGLEPSTHQDGQTSTVPRRRPRGGDPESVAITSASTSPATRLVSGRICPTK
jgi:hypothetical protein